MENRNSLGLQIPEQMAAPADSFLVSPREVAAWIDALPLANIGETSRQVFKTLVEFNRLEVPDPSRLRIAELMRKPVDYICANLRKYFFDAAFPLSAKNRKIAVLNRELYAELANAYKIYVENMICSRAGKPDRKLLVVAFHRAIEALYMVAYQSAVVYDPYPATLWRELHRLYAYAEQNTIHDIPVKEPSQGKKGTSTIREIYCRALLFSICSPYSLRQREISQLDRVLPEWTRLTRLGMPESSSTSGSRFIVRLGSDEPPIHSELQAREPSKRCRTLDCSALVKRLQEQLNQGPASTPISGRDPMLEHNLLRKLIEILSNAPKRGFVRTKLNFELRTAVGLSAIHALLRQEEEQPVKEEPLQPGGGMDWLNQASSIPGLGLGRYTLNENRLSLEQQNLLSEEQFTLGGIRSQGSAHDAAPAWTSIGREQEFEPFVCKTINESAGGYCILWQGADAPRIKVGELIGIQSATQKNQFGIGVSRWMKNMPGQGLLLGMEMIAPSSRPVSVRPMDVDSGQPPQKGLLLPELKAAGQPSCLLLPILPFKVGHELWLEDDSGERQIRLTRLLESSGAFSRFEYSYTSSKSSGNNRGDDETDFDTIWSTL